MHLQVPAQKEECSRLMSNISILMHRDIKEEKLEVQVQSQVCDIIRMPQTWWESTHLAHCHGRVEAGKTSKGEGCKGVLLHRKACP